MAHLERWLKGAGAHLREHLTRHLLPGAAILVGLVLFGWGLMLAYALIFGGTFALLALEQETAAMVCFFGVSALGSLFMVLFQLAGAVFLLGYSRYALLLQRGAAPTWHELLWGFRHPLRSVGMVLLVVMVVFASAGLFYLPLIFLGGWLLLSAPSLAEGDRGVLGSFGRAWRLSGRAYGELLLAVMIVLFLGFFLSLAPIIGPVIVPVAGVVLGAVIYDDLLREESP